MQTEKRDASVIRHIYNYCVEIQEDLEYISYSKEKYDNSKVLRNSFALCVLQIGELVSVLSDDYKQKHPEIPWRDIKALRNIVAHHYGSFNYDVLWDVLQNDIPDLKVFCERELS